MKHFILIIAGLVFGSELNASENIDNCPNKHSEMIGGYNAPARIQLKNGYNTFLTFTFLYMQALENGLSPAISNPSGAQYYPNASGSYLNLSRKYKPGFRIGIGHSFDHDDWDVCAKYTRFYQTSRLNSTAPAGGSLISLWLSTQNQGFSNSVSSRWNLSMDILDLELGRAAFSSPKLVFRPFFGIRAMWIDQDYLVNYYDLLSSKVGGVFSSKAISNNVCDSWSVGPRFGFDTEWRLGKGVRLFGDFGASLAYSNFDVFHKETNSENTLPSIQIKSDPSNLRPNVGLSLGLGWGDFLKKERYHLDFSAGYEIQTFWNQNEMNNLGRFAGFTFGGGGANLSIHGLGMRLKFEF